MKLTQEELFDVVKKLKTSRTTYPSVDTVADEVARILSIKVDDDLKTCIKNELRILKKVIKKMQSKASRDRETIGDNSKVVIDSDDYTPVECNIANEPSSPPPEKKLRK